MENNNIILDQGKKLSKEECNKILKDFTWLGSIIVYNKDNTSYIVIHLGEKVKKKSTNQLILEKLDNLESKVDKIDERLMKVESRLDNIESEAKKHGWNV